MMPRRPLTIMAASFAGGAAIAGAVTAPSRIVPVLCGGAAAAALLLFCVFICKNNSYMGYTDVLSRRILICVLLAAVFFTSGFGACRRSLSLESQFAGYAEKTVRVSGVVKSAESKEDGKAALVIVLTGNAPCVCDGTERKQRREKMLVRVYEYEGVDPRLLTGKEVSITGKVYLPQGASNPGAFDYARYLRSEKIRACISAAGNGITARGTASPAARRLAVFKYRYEQRLLTTLEPGAASMLCGILFGDTSLIDDELTDSFRENGIGHLLAASGLHVGFVYGIVSALFRRPRTFAGNLPVLFILVVYAALCDFSASVVRAVLMITVRIISKTALQRYDFLSSISLVALLLLMYEPAYIFSSGFLLSFMAVTSLAVLLPVTEKLFAVEKADIREMLPADRRRYRFRKYCADTVSVTLALQAGMTPLSLSSFHYISPAGLLLNTPAIALAGLIVPVGIVLMPLAAAPAALWMPAALTDEMLVNLLLLLNDAADGRRFSCVYLPSPPAAVTLFFYFALLFFCGESGRRFLGTVRKHVSAASVTAVLLIIAAGAAACAGTGSACDRDYLLSDLTFVDVGQGDCAHLKAGKYNILIDSGGSDRRDIGRDVLMPYFLGNGVDTIDLAVISHLHTDHYGGLKTLTQYVRVKKLLVSEAYRSELDQITADTGIPAGDILFAEAGDRIRIGGAVIDIAAPFPRTKEEFARLAADEDAENDCSLVARVTYRGISALFTGDIDEELEKQLVQSGSGALSSDILKVAHHGSRYSSCSAFLSSVHPSAAVIQVGRNTYGHPTQEAMDRITAAGARIYRNDTQGAVMIRFSDPAHFSVYTMK